MGRRTVELPLPGQLGCRDCAAALHAVLGSTPGVYSITVEAARSVVVIEFDETALAFGQLMTGVAKAFVGTKAVRGLDDLHASHPSSPVGLASDSTKPAAGSPVQGSWPSDAPRSPATAGFAAAVEAEGHEEDGHHGHEGHDHAIQHGGDPHAHGDVTSLPHRHDHAREQREMAVRNRKRLLFVALSGTVVMTAEIVAGLLSNSLVLLADAAHYATDILAVLLAFAAVSWSMRPATRRNTFGFHRAEVVSAFIQAIGLWGISIYFLWEAYQRILAPPTVEGPIVAVVGGASMVINAGLAWVLQRGGGHNINMRAAYVHILSDVLGSAAALGAGLLIYFYGLHIADPILTLFITVLILMFTWKLTKQSIHILLDGSPAHADPDQVMRDLRELPEVKDVHDLHVWTLTSGVDSVSAHIVLAQPPQSDRISHEIHRRLRKKYGIEHITIQVEDPTCPCDTLQHSWIDVEKHGAHLAH